MFRCLVSAAATTLLAACASAAAVSPTAFHPNAMLSGAAGIGSTSHMRTPSSGGFVYVANVTQFNISHPPSVGSVLYFPAGSNGDVAPAGVIAGANTMLTLVDGIVVDGSGEIYVANTDTNSIVGFPAGSSGNVTPNIVIAGSNTGLASPIGLAIDASGNLFVANCGQCNYGPPGQNSVEEFAAGSNGNVTPARKIAGNKAELGYLNQIAVDRQGEIYVANETANAVLVFGRAAKGNVAPIRVIAGPNSRIDEPDGMALGPAGIYVTTVAGNYVGRFARDAGGNVAPRSTLHVAWSGNGKQALGGVIVAPDNTLYVAGFGAPLIAQFSAKAKGKQPPLAVIEGAQTQIVLPTFVYVR
jgi:sugar lactone lactonase YvrE